MKVDLLDPALLRRGGHHHEWCRVICASLAGRGHRVSVHCHRQIERVAAEALAEHAEIVPVFRANPYDGMRLRGPDDGLRTWFLETGAALADDLKQVDPAGVSLAPSLFPPLLYAYGLARPDMRLGGCIHDDPALAPMFGAGFWQEAACTARARGVALTLGVTTPELQALYREVFRDVLEAPCVLPICHQGVRSPAPKTALRRIGFFGRQDRAPKGVHQLFQPLGKALTGLGYEVVLHDSSARVDTPFDFPLTRLGYVPDLAAAMRGCDLVVVPYDARAYRNSGSGIVWDALASGVPALAPADTSAGRTILAAGAGAVFGESTVDGICTAVGQVRQRYPQVAEAAHRLSVGWLAHHGAERFTNALTGRVPEPESA